jgi:aconitase A
MRLLVPGNSVLLLTLDERITISSMATEMGAIIIFFTPTKEILTHFEKVIFLCLPTMVT